MSTMTLYILLLSILIGACTCLPTITAGPRFKVYDPDKQSLFYVNDHTFILSTNWHIIGITHTNPADPSYEVNLAHATTSTNITRLNNSMNNNLIFMICFFINFTFLK